MARPSGAQVGLPVRAFLFTLDQVAYMVGVSEAHLKTHYVHYYGRSIGSRPPDRFMTRNIAPAGEKPDWRVTERELIRWLKNRGFRVYERGWPTM
jgi:hypothetical protein